MADLESTAEEDQYTLTDEIFRAWQTVFCSLILLLQLGYILLEVGSVRSKHGTSIILKNLAEFSLSAMAFLVVGYALVCPTGVTGAGFATPVVAFSVDNVLVLRVQDYILVLIHTLYAATLGAVVSGAMAERGDNRGVFAFAVCLSCIVYPLPAYWVWGPDGWLAQLGYIDVAGGTVVFLAGGVAALVSAYMAGPRIGRFGEDGTPRKMLGHSIPLATMGFLLMWLGLLGVMCAGVVQQYLVADANRSKNQLTRVLANDLGAAALNMMTCAAFAYVAAPGVAWMVRGDRITLVAGGLAWVTGCIASCCGTKYMTPWASAVLGLVAGALYVPVSALLVRCRIDDPITAVTVHTVGGFVGAVGVGVFAHRDGEEGAVYGGWRQLGVQVGGALSIAAWALVVSGVFWGCMRWLRMARVSEDAELQGADEHLFCEPAYPENYAMADYLMFKQFVETHWPADTADAQQEAIELDDAADRR